MDNDERAERVAKRVRAALAYAGLTYEDAAERIPDLGAATLRRIALMTNPRGATLHELGHIALACDVPLEWLTGGRWVEDDEPRSSPFPELKQGSRERRLAVVEHYLEQLLLLEQRREGYPVPPPPPDEQQRALSPGRARRARSSA